MAISAALVVLLLVLLAAPAVFATTELPFTLSASSNQLYYGVKAGTVFNGSISTTGDVRFWVSAPNAEEIVNLGIVDKSASFSFVAQQNGTYTMNFEEDTSNTVTVTFSYTSNLAVSDLNATGINLLYLVVTVLVAVFGSILIIIIIRRRNKLPPTAIYRWK
jgi:hypothetical protein